MLLPMNWGILSSKFSPVLSCQSNVEKKIDDRHEFFSIFYSVYKSINTEHRNIEKSINGKRYRRQKGKETKGKGGSCRHLIEKDCIRSVLTFKLNFGVFYHLWKIVAKIRLNWYDFFVQNYIIITAFYFLRIKCHKRESPLCRDSNLPKVFIYG